MLIAARNGFLAGGKLSAKSYPYMPDVGFWDGIENIGFGQHSANPAQWFDLSGNERHFTGLACLDGFSNDSAIFAQRNGSNQSWNIPYSSIKTIEIIGKSSQTGSYLAFNFVPEGTRLFAILPTNNRGFQFKSNAPSMYKDWWSARWSAVCTFENEDRPIQYYNSEVGLLNDGTSTWSSIYPSIGYTHSSSKYGFVGEICRVGLHSSILTAAEVAANYAIDKERFNLPDA